MEIATRRREQEVWQACDDLWALHGEMIDITGDAIRERLICLGKSRGSPNEIYKYRKTWVKSRGLTNTNDNALNTEDDDPITRAVKLVHEKLKSEANDHIVHLQEEFEVKIKQKEEQLTKTKQALDQIMIDFSGLDKELNLSRTEQKSLQEKLLAEIEIRKVSERELQMHKTLREEEKKAHEILVVEMKQLHQQQLELCTTKEQEREKTTKDLFDKLLEEKKQLGYEYSEKLNELKTTIYNQNISIKQMEIKVIDSNNEIGKLINRLAEKDQQIELLGKENTKLSTILSAQKTEIYLTKEIEKSKNIELRNLLTTLKKSELTIARLRACAAKSNYSAEYIAVRPGRHGEER